MISIITKFEGKIIYNKKFPDGTPRKILDSSNIIKIGWKPKIKLYDGIFETIKSFNKI